MFFTTVLIALAQSSIINTTCNLRFNNLGIIYGHVPCQVQFKNGKLNYVNFTYPRNNVRYTWKVNHTNITADPRWAECIRHTAPRGDQWQVCSVPSPKQLGI